jgi:hypothetical protein
MPLKSILMMIAVLAATPVLADVVNIPEGSSSMVAKPVKGTTMKTVEHQFGAPFKKHAAVGGGSVRQPPITRWDYPAFSVFFEHGHVVDAVVPGSPPPVQHSDELKPAAS